MAEGTYTNTQDAIDAINASTHAYEYIKKAGSTNLVISWGSHYQDTFHRFESLTTMQFAGESYSNFDVLYFRDNEGLFYLDGLSGVEGGSWKGLATYQLVKSQSYNSGKVTHIGSREGGYAAILFACLGNKNNSHVYAIHPTLDLTEVDSAVDDTGSENEWFNRVKSAEKYNTFKSIDTAFSSTATNLPSPFSAPITANTSIMDYATNVTINVGDTNTRETQHTSHQRPPKPEVVSKGEGNEHNNILTKKSFIEDAKSAGATEIDGLDNNWEEELQDLFD